MTPPTHGSDEPASSNPSPTARSVSETDGERSVVEIVRALRSGDLAGKSLAPGDRRRCVEHLSAEGCSVVEISDILRVNERTVHRDRKAIREANALTVDPAFAGQMAGTLLGTAEQAMTRIRRFARDRETPAAIKIDAERQCWTITRQLVDTLQSLGYLPRAAQRVDAALTHHIEPPLDDDALAQELAFVETVMREATTDPSLLSQLDHIRGEVARLAVGRSLQSLKSHLSEASTDGTPIPTTSSAPTPDITP